MTHKALAIYLIFAAFFLGPVLSAQAVHNQAVGLKNWPAPLYWQPSPTGSGAGTSLVHANVRTPNDSAVPSFLTFVAMTPCRVVDTRASSGFASPFGTPSLSAGTVRSFPIQSSTTCSIPATAQAYSFNVTVVPPRPVGYLILWPEGQPQPNVVTLDDINGDIRNNAAIVPAGTSGGISAVVNATTDLVIDINGYYSPPSDVGSNTALGFQALTNNQSFDNTAIGNQALSVNLSGTANTAVGNAALGYFITGSDNTAIGYQALEADAGNGNTAFGSQTLFDGAGSFNIAIGDFAGGEIDRNASNDIDIGEPGRADESGVVRIGTSLQRLFFAAGIAGVAVSNQAEVVINPSTGQLGTVSSSRRYKEEVQDMSDASSALLQLRPITFRYREPSADGSKPLEYGLLAEEVAEVFPELISRNADGQIETVQYHRLIPMLLNELQKVHTRRKQDHETAGSLHQAVDTLQAQIATLQKALETLPAGKVTTTAEVVR